jgi:hypothetical protein
MAVCIATVQRSIHGGPKVIFLRENPIRFVIKPILPPPKKILQISTDVPFGAKAAKA